MTVQPLVRGCHAKQFLFRLESAFSPHQCKWNKGIYDLKALKDDINDGTIGGGGTDKTKLSEFINDVPFVSESSLIGRLDAYATKDWVNLMLASINSFDLSRYISKDEVIGTINGKQFKYGSSIEISGGGDGINWTDIQAGIYWDGIYGAANNTYKLGDISIGGIKTPIYAKEGGSSSGTANVSYTAEQSVVNDSTRYTLGTLTVGSQNYTIYGKDNVGTGGGGTTSILRWTDIVYTKNDSNTNAPASPYIDNGQFIYHDVNNTIVWYDHAPNASLGEYIWVCWVTYIMEGDVKTCINIEGPKCISGEDGNPGADSPSTEFIYRRASRSESVEGRWGLDSNTGHIGNGVQPVSNTGQDDFVPDQWNDNPSGVTKNIPFEYMAFRVSNVINGSRSWENVTFQGPYLWSHWGEDGTDGDGVEYIFSDPVPANYSSGTMDEGLTIILNRNFGYSASSSSKQYVGAPEYINSHEIADLLEFNNGEIHWHDNPPTITEQGKVVYCAIRRYVNEVWTEFCVPAIWSSLAKDGTSETFAGTFHYMTVSPSIIKKSADGQFPGGNTISLNIFKSENNVISKTYPNQGGNGTKLWQSINGGGWDEITSMSSSVSTYSYSVSDNVSNVAFKFVNEDGYELCTASVPVIVDGSILIGQDGYEVSIDNDAWVIPCDSNNIITGLSYNGGAIETSPVSAYSGSSKLNISSIKVNNVEITNEASYSVNGCRIVINGTKVNGYYTEILWTRISGDSGSDSVYNVENAVTKIPFTITFDGNDGNNVTRVKYITAYRVNSGSPGVSPVIYKLNIHNDTISGTYSSGSYSWSESEFHGSVIRKVGNVSRTIENTQELTAEGLRIYAGTTLVSNGSSSQFTYSSGQFTTKGSYGTAALFNANSANRGFTFYLKDTTGNIQDSEDVTYVLDGQPGEPGRTGEQGLQGCVIRTSLIDDGTSSTVYRNDENYATTNTRYIDIVGSPNINASDGFDWYKVRPANGTYRVISGVASMRNYITNYTSNSTVLEKLSDVGGIYASFILAKNAKIKFLTNNELTVVDSNNNPVAGITGGGNVSSDDPNVRFWAGTASWDGSAWEDLIVSNAAFRVYNDGSLVATQATITGNILASNEHIYLGECTEGPQWVSEDYRTQGTDVIAIKDGNNDGTSIVIGSDPSDSGAINQINKDGSGHLANGKVKWNRVGNFQLGEIPTGTGNANAIELNQYSGAVSVKSKLIDSGTGLRYTRTDIDSTGITYTATGQKNGVVQATDVELFHVQGDCTSDGIPTLQRNYGISVVGQLTTTSQPKSYSGYSGTVTISGTTLYFVNGLFVGTSDTGVDPRAKQWSSDSIWYD